MTKALLLVLFATAPALGQTFTPVLFPLAFATPHESSYGAVWVTDTVIHNAGDHEVFIESINCGGFFECTSGDTIVPMETVTNPSLDGQYSGRPGLEGSVPGRLVGVAVSDLPAVSFSIVLRDATVPRAENETAIPVVRAAMFSDVALDVLHVPFNEGTRVTLRIYTLDDHAETFVVNIFKVPEDGIAMPDELIRTIPITTSAAVENRNGNLQIPGYAQLDDLQLLAPGLGRARIEVVPVANAGFWAMASGIASATHHVTIYAPDHP